MEQATVVEKLEKNYESSKSKEAIQVTEDDISEVVSMWTGIPLKRLDNDDKERLKNIENVLSLDVIGQNDAIEAISKSVRRARTGLKDPKRPIGAFLFLGPTGVGKTHLVKRLSEFLIGTEDAMVRFDMSEYMERHTVSRLIGAPPGYVGFDQGGLLTEAVNKNPHCVLLLDEIEKAHPEVFNLLLQVMDHGTLTDNNGRKADFRNVILIMTTNAGAETISRRSIGFSHQAHTSDGREVIRKQLTPEFRNRLDSIIQFASLTRDNIMFVVDKFLVDLQAQLDEKKVHMRIDDDARNWFAENGYDEKMGARPMNRLIQEKLKKPLAERILFGDLEGGGEVEICLNDAKDGIELHLVEEVVA